MLKEKRDPNDPKKCDTCVGYGNTHERSCPKFTRTVMDPCPQCARFREKLDREKVAEAMYTDGNMYGVPQDLIRIFCRSAIAYLTE